MGEVEGAHAFVAGRDGDEGERDDLDGQVVVDALDGNEVADHCSGAGAGEHLVPSVDVGVGVLAVAVNADLRVLVKDVAAGEDFFAR